MEDQPRYSLNGASIVTINFPQLVLWTIILIILVIALLGGFSGIGGGPFYGTGAGAFSYERGKGSVKLARTACILEK
jgi:hypothetical protein